MSTLTAAAKAFGDAKCACPSLTYSVKATFEDKIRFSDQIDALLTSKAFIKTTVLIRSY